MEKKEIIAKLMQNGAEPVKNLKVKNVTVTPQENYVRVALTLDKPVKGMVSKDQVTYEEGETNVIFVSSFSLISMLRDNDEASFAANHLLKNPDSLSVILNRATIDILQEAVVEGQEYRNPWSENTETEATVFDHNTIINHVTDIRLSEFGIKKLDRLADKLLGF